jgi:hypothetical protein
MAEIGGRYSIFFSLYCPVLHSNEQKCNMKISSFVNQNKNGFNVAHMRSFSRPTSEDFFLFEGLVLFRYQAYQTSLCSREIDRYTNFALRSQRCFPRARFCDFRLVPCKVTTPLVRKQEIAVIFRCHMISS